MGSWSDKRSAGFTIVELLVVIAVIGALVGLLLPALAAVRASSKKTQEMNHLRQINSAWNLYGSQNNDAAMPGYMDAGVQQAWNLKYKYPDGNPIPEINAATWTWRLLPFMSYSGDTVLGYLDQADPDLVRDTNLVSQNPAFGYNALFIGGWWDMQAGSSGQEPTQRYGTFNVVARGISNANSNMVVFCSSAVLPTGIHKDMREEVPGSHYVVPPLLRNEMQWQSAASTFGAGFPAPPIGGNDPSVLQTYSQEPVPVGRHKWQAAVLFGDGRTQLVVPGTLADMRKWAYRATTLNYTF